MAGNVSTVVGQPRTYEAQDSITRLANTTQYADGDILSDHATVPTAGAYFTLDFKTKQGGSVMLTDFTLHKSDLDETAADFDVLLFTTLPTLANLDDNAACAITDAEMQECKGVIRFVNGSWSNVAIGNFQAVQQTVGVVFASTDTILYGVVVVQGTYTPASGEIFTLTAKGIQD